MTTVNRMRATTAYSLSLRKGDNMEDHQWKEVFDEIAFEVCRILWPETTITEMHRGIIKSALENQGLATYVRDQIKLAGIYALRRNSEHGGMQLEEAGNHVGDSTADLTPVR
jgi:hypothetical protein